MGKVKGLTVQGDRKAAETGVKRCEDNQGSEVRVKGLTEGNVAAAGGGGGAWGGATRRPLPDVQALAGSCRPWRGRASPGGVEQALAGSRLRTRRISTPRPAEAASGRSPEACVGGSRSICLACSPLSPGVAGCLRFGARVRAYASQAAPECAFSRRGQRILQRYEIRRFDPHLSATSALQPRSNGSGRGALLTDALHWDFLLTGPVSLLLVNVHEKLSLRLLTWLSRVRPCTATRTPGTDAA